MKDKNSIDRSVSSVAGGTKREFEEIRNALHMEGSSPEQVKAFLKKNNIIVSHWNMGHLGFGQKPAEYHLADIDGTKLTHAEVLDWAE